MNANTEKRSRGFVSGLAFSGLQRVSSAALTVTEGALAFAGLGGLTLLFSVGAVHAKVWMRVKRNDERE